MKKLTASIVASALMISAMGINAFAAGTPKITVFGNENNPVEAGSEVSVDVRLSNFEGIKGMDITLKGDTNVELKEIVTDGYTLNENYTVKNNEIHIVDLNNAKTVNLKVKAVAKADGEITVATANLAESGTKLAENVTKVKGTVKVAAKAQTTAEANDKLAPTDSTKYFIPYGSVYTVENETYEYIIKGTDGTFDVPANVTWQEFALPENGITTFGASEDIETKVPQFGSYATNVNGKTYGTMSMVGDWEGFVEYYRNNNGLTVEKLVESVSAYYDANAEQIDGTTYTHVVLNWGENKTLKIYKKAQVNWMWKDGTNLQYALRVNGLTQGEKCTAVGYSVKGNNVTFSTVVQTTAQG